MITTILLTVSRDEFLPDVLSGLELIDCDPSYTNILCVVDGDSRLFTKVRNLIQDTKFNERLTVHYKNPKPVKRFDYMARRKRIAAIHNYAKTLVGICDYVFLTEDDTVVPRDALKKLTQHIKETVGCAFVEGVEVGRWGIPYVGVWKFDDIYDPQSVTSFAYKSSGVESIDAGGFYCAIVDASLYKSHNFHLYESLGPDVSMGLAFRQEGYVNLVDWSVPCKHLNRTRKGEREVLIPNESVEQVTLVKKNENNWG